MDTTTFGLHSVSTYVRTVGKKRLYNELKELKAK